MASVEECEQALHALAQRLGSVDSGTRRRAEFDRTLSCRLRDPDVAFAGRLRAGSLTEIRQVDGEQAGAAQVRLTLTGDDLVSLVAGDLKMASAWSSGRLRIDAGMLDLLRLRSMF